MNFDLLLECCERDDSDVRALVKDEFRHAGVAFGVPVVGKVRIARAFCVCCC